MVAVPETFPGVQPSINQKSDSQTVPVGQDDLWVDADDMNEVGQFDVVLSRMSRLQAMVTATVAGGNNGKAGRFTGINGTSGLGSADSSFSTDLNKTWAAFVEKIEQGGDLDGTASAGNLMGVYNGIISGTFTAGALYDLSSDGSLIPHVSGAHAPIARGLTATTAYVDMGGRVRADNVGIEFNISGALKIKSGAVLTFGNTDINGTLTVSGSTTLSATLTVAGATTFNGAITATSTYKGSSTNGVDLGDGNAADQDLITVDEGTTDASRPRLRWDDSEDEFELTKGLTVKDAFTISGNTPDFQLFETGATVDEGRWRWRANNDDFVFETRDDNDGSGTNIIKIERTGKTPTLYKMMTLNVEIQRNFQRGPEAGITASTTQTQAAATLLTKDIVEIATVANANDAVKLPVIITGSSKFIINNGANTVQIFPGESSGDKINGGAADASITLAAGSSIKLYAIDDNNWYS